MERIPSAIPVTQNIANLSARTSPWLGWQIQFFSNISATQISSAKLKIEKSLNDELQANVNVAANNLIVPFRIRMVPDGGNGKTFRFEAIVYRKFLFIKIRFSYPAQAILRYNGYTIAVVWGSGTDSPVSTVALRPPSPVK